MGKSVHVCVHVLQARLKESLLPDLCLLLFVLFLIVEVHVSEPSHESKLLVSTKTVILVNIVCVMFVMFTRSCQVLLQVGNVSVI